jgi:hypothetical protein
MRIQYLSNEKGQVTAVQLPIDEWELIKMKFPEVEHLDSELPDWLKSLIDLRLSYIQENPQRIKPIADLLEELDQLEE